MKKICFLTDSIFSIGGVQRVTAVIAKELATNYDVTIITFDDPNHKDTNLYGLVDSRINYSFFSYPIVNTLKKRIESDLEDQRQVNKEQGEEKAKELGLAFMETSACSGENLEKAFQLMINEVYKKCQEDIAGETEENAVEPGKDITLDKAKGKPEKKKCC